MENGFLQEPLPTGIRTMLERRQHAVAASLASASRSELEEEVAGMMTGFPSMRGLSKIEAQVLVRKYAEDLVGIPLWAIHAACRDISRGTVSDLNPDFAPSASRVRQQADEHLERIEREAKDLRTVLKAQVLPPENPDRSAKINLGFQELQQRMRSYVSPLEPPKPPASKAPTAEELSAHYAVHGLGFRRKETDQGNEDI